MAGIGRASAAPGRGVARGPPVTPPDDLAALRVLSVRIGRDPLLIQAAGGNTSVKEGDALWVKASGVRLAEVEEREGFVAADLDALRRDLAEAPERTDDPARYAPSGGLRPSIETTLHALMPHRIVVHVHDVGAIARLCVEEAAEAMDPLAGLPAALVPYARPGLPLTLAVRDAPGREEARVLLLRNHGTVVAAETVEDAAALLADVSARLSLAPRDAPSRDPALDAAWAGRGFRPARDRRAHGLATDPRALAVAASGTLYPDHAIFLGPGVVVADGPGHPIDGAPLVLDPGHGAFLRADALEAAQDMATCLADVALRVRGTPRPLAAGDEAALTGWDAEHHRRALAR